jgi:hypothetical protein
MLAASWIDLVQLISHSRVFAPAPNFEHPVAGSSKSLNQTPTDTVLVDEEEHLATGASCSKIGYGCFAPGWRVEPAVEVAPLCRLAGNCA